MYIFMQKDRPVSTSGFALSPSLPLSPGEGCAETPPGVGSCLAEENLLAYSEEAVRSGLVHEETHNEGKCAPQRSSGEWCSSVWIRASHPSPSLSPHPLYYCSPLTLPLTITPHPTPSQEARTRCGVMYEAVTGIPKVSRLTADTFSSDYVRS